MQPQPKSTPSSPSQAPYYRLVLTSAHYNTQLGLISAMALDKFLTPAALPWLASIPATSSVLAFELHTSADSATAGQQAAEGNQTAGQVPRFAVRMMVQNGPDAGYVPVPLPPCAASRAADADIDAAEALAGPGACELGAFVRAFSGSALKDAGAWCAECDNGEVDACVAFKARSGSWKTASWNTDGASWRIAVAVMASVLGTAALAAAAFALHRRRERRKWDRAGWPAGGLPPVGETAAPREHPGKGQGMLSV